MMINGVPIRFPRGRRWTWRWLVVIQDLPPMPPYAECMEGFLTKWMADGVVKETRRYLQSPHLRDAVKVSVERWRPAR